MKKALISKNFLLLLVLVGVGVFVYFAATGGIKLDTGSIQLSGTSSPAVDNIGDLTLQVLDGKTNVTGTAISTEDYYDDDKTFLTFYSADVNIDDGNEYTFNISIERSNVQEAAAVKVYCTFPDKELAGLAIDNIIQKTNGKVDADINDAGTAEGDNAVWKTVTFAAGTSTAVAVVAADHEEDYHDQMQDLDDYVDFACTVTDAVTGAHAKTVTARVYANS